MRKVYSSIFIFLFGVSSGLGCGGGGSNNTPTNSSPGTSSGSSSNNPSNTSPDTSSAGSSSGGLNTPQSLIITSLPPRTIINENENFSYEIVASDSDQNSLTYTVSHLAQHSTFDSSSHTFSWTPQNGDAGTYNIDFIVSDGAEHVTQTITFTVAHVNHPPTISVVNQSINEGQALHFTVTAQDVDNDSLSFFANNLPNGSAFDANSHIFSWTPNYSQSGSYQVTFSVSDGEMTASQTITISVGNVNLPPQISAIGNQSVNENQLLSFIIRATDPENDSLTYSASSLPSGALFNSSSHTFSWTPSYSQAGTYSITFQVSDGFHATSQTITVTVNNVNRPPTLNPIPPVTVGEGELISINLAGADPDGIPLTYSSTNLPDGSSLNSTTGLFQWYPDLNQSGTYDVIPTLTP